MGSVPRWERVLRFLWWLPIWVLFGAGGGIALVALWMESPWIIAGLGVVLIWVLLGLFLKVESERREEADA